MFSTREDDDRSSLCPLFTKIGEYVTRVLQDGYISGINFQIATRTKQGIVYQLQGKKGSGIDPSFVGQWDQEIPFQDASFLDKASFGVRLLSKGPISFQSVVDMSSQLGLTATLSAFDNDRLKTQLDWQTRRASFSTNVSFGVVPKWDSSVVVGFSHLLVATQVVLEQGKVPSWVVACNYQDGESGQVTLFIHDRGRSVTVSDVFLLDVKCIQAFEFVL